MKKVSVSRAAVTGRGHDAGAAQNHLVDHKLAVVFADRAFGFFEVRVRQIRAVRPFPAQAPIEALVRRFPFEFSRQPQAFPFGKRCRFVKRNVTDRIFQIQFSQAAERELKPFAVNFFPVERRFYFVLINPVPAFGVPEPKIRVTAVFDKFEIFAVGDEVFRNRKILQINPMAGEFVVKTKAFALETDFINSARKLGKLFRRCGFASFL